MITIYWALIHPYLNYGLVVWGQTSKHLFDKLLILQKRAIRLIYFTNSKVTPIPLFIKAQIPPLNLMYFQSIANLMYDVVHKNAPINLCNLFTPVSNVHSYATRSATMKKLHIKSSRLNKQLNSFSRLGARLWNSIPLDTRNKSKFSFKMSIKSTLFHILEQEKSYVEVSNVIQLLSKPNQSTYFI